MGECKGPYMEDGDGKFCGCCCCSPCTPVHRASASSDGRSRQRVTHRHCHFQHARIGNLRRPPTAMTVQVLQKFEMSVCMAAL